MPDEDKLTKILEKLDSDELGFLASVVAEKLQREIREEEDSLVQGIDNIANADPILRKILRGKLVFPRGILFFDGGSFYRVDALQQSEENQEVVKEEVKE